MARTFANSKDPKFAPILKELNELSALQLQVYLMKLNGLTHKEIAEKTGLSVGTVDRYSVTMSQTEFVKSMREDVMQLRPLIFEALIDNLRKKKEVTLNAVLKGMGVYEEKLGIGKGDGVSSASDDDLRKIILGYLFGSKAEPKPEGKAKDEPVTILDEPENVKPESSGEVDNADLSSLRLKEEKNES